MAKTPKPFFNNLKCLIVILLFQVFVRRNWGNEFLIVGLFCVHHSNRYCAEDWIFMSKKKPLLWVFYIFVNIRLGIATKREGGSPE